MLRNLFRYVFVEKTGFNLLRMKFRILWLFILITFISLTANAQEIVLPIASPKANVSQTIGLTEVSVQYHTPSVKGREIWGKLVPFGKVWRTGANEATLVTFSDDVVVQGEKLKAGTYSLFTIPESHDNWTIIFNKNPNQWGAFDYKESEDVLRVPVQAIPGDFHETLFFSFTNIKPTSGELNINWEKIRIPIRIEVEVEKKAISNIRSAISQAKPDDWRIYAQAVSYLIQQEKEADLALEYINKSISINDNFYNNWLKAQLMAQHNEYREAVTLVKKAIKLGDKEKDTYKQYATDLELDLKEWRTKQN
jgi:tetratricopeptide (TPR) repeat protein